MADAVVRIDLAEAFGGGKATLDERLEHATQMAERAIDESAPVYRRGMIEKMASMSPEAVADACLGMMRQASARVAREFVLRAEVTRQEQRAERAEAELRKVREDLARHL